jgi:hypothetical protein
VEPLILSTVPLVTIFAEFAKGVLTGIASWWFGKGNIVTLATPVRIKIDNINLDMLA